MSKYLVKVTEVYRIPSVVQVKQFQEELSSDSTFTLASFSYATKYVKEKKEIVDEYQLVTVVKQFNDVKEPDSVIEVSYERKSELFTPKSNTVSVETDEETFSDMFSTYDADSVKDDVEEDGGSDD